MAKAATRQASPQRRKNRSSKTPQRQVTAKGQAQLTNNRSGKSGRGRKASLRVSRRCGREHFDERHIADYFERA